MELFLAASVAHQGLDRDELLGLSGLIPSERIGKLVGVERLRR